MISANHMMVIARAEQYSDGMLYLWPGGFWSEISPESGKSFSRWHNWYVRTRVVFDMLEEGLATVQAWEHTNTDSIPIAVKIKAP